MMGMRPNNFFVGDLAAMTLLQARTLEAMEKRDTLSQTNQVDPEAALAVADADCARFYSQRSTA